MIWRRFWRQVSLDVLHWQRSAVAHRDRERVASRPTLGHHDQPPLGWTSRGQGSYFTR